ncbi:zinc finger, CCHC-type containing protein [Tanacetum coccineum]
MISIKGSLLGLKSTGYQNKQRVYTKMMGTKFDIEKFDGTNDFALWQLRMKALLEQQGLADGGSQSEYIDEFRKLLGDLAAIDNAISDEDQAFLLLTSLSSSYDGFVETLLYGQDTLKLEDVLATLNFRELQKMTEAKGDGGEGLYVRGRSGQNRYGAGYNHKKSQGFVKNKDQVSGSGADGECRVWGTGKVQVQMMDGSSFVFDNVRYVPKLRRNLISLGTLEKEVFTVKMQSGKIKVIKGSLMALSGTRRANCVYTLDGQAVTRKTLKGGKQLGEYQTRWKIKTGNVLDSCNQRSTQQCTKSGVTKHLGVAGLQQQNGLVKETNLTLLAKVVLYRNMGFNESGEYKKTFIGSGVGTGSMQVLQGVEFEVEPQDDHKFEVEPHGNVDHVVDSHYREDSNEAAFAVAAVEKIYAHESLTFNNTVAFNGCKKCSDDIDGYYWEYTPAKRNILGMEIVRDESGNTLRVSQSRFYNEKLVQTLLDGHSILSLEGSLSGDCDVEKNGKWSCIYAVGSQEYQMVCTRLDIESADVGMLDKFDRGLQTDVYVFVDFDYAMAVYMTLTEAAKEAIWLKGLSIESGFELKIVAGIATGPLSKAIPGSRVLQQFSSFGIIYEAYLVFKFCDPKTDSSEQYVKLKYKIASRTLNSYVVERRDDEWMMIESCRFRNHDQVIDFEVLLKSFSGRSCGSGPIYVDGIEFRPIDSDDRTESVHRLINADSSINWDQQSTSDFKEIMKNSRYDVLTMTKQELYTLLITGVLIDNGEKSSMLYEAAKCQDGVLIHYFDNNKGKQRTKVELGLKSKGKMNEGDNEGFVAVKPKKKSQIPNIGNKRVVEMIRNKNKQKNASKKRDMFSDEPNEMSDLGGGKELGDSSENVDNGDKTMEDDGSKGSTRVNQAGKENGVRVEVDERDEVCLDERGEVCLDEEINMLTELKRDPTIGMEKVEQTKVPLWVTLVNLPMEAWSTEGISALASSLGKPLIMDNITARRCQYGEGRLDFARVLVEFDVIKRCKDKIEVQYIDSNNNVKGLKQVKMEYAWKPKVCSHCHVFGHSFENCTKRVKSIEEIERDAKREEDLVRQRIEENKKKMNYGNGMENRSRSNKGEVWRKKDENDGKFNRQKNKGKQVNKKGQNEDKARNGNKYDILNGLGDDNDELEIPKGRKNQKEINKRKEDEERDDDMEDVLESEIAKEVNTEEVRGIERRNLWNELRRMKSSFSTGGHGLLLEFLMLLSNWKNTLLEDLE